MNTENTLQGDPNFLKFVLAEISATEDADFSDYSCDNEFYLVGDNNQDFTVLLTDVCKGASDYITQLESERDENARLKDEYHKLRSGERKRADAAELKLSELQKKHDALGFAYNQLDNLVQDQYGWSFGKYSDFANAYDELPYPDMTQCTIKIEFRNSEKLEPTKEGDDDDPQA